MPADPTSILLFVVLGGLLVFMFWNSRKRMKKAKEEQEEKRRQTLPGAKVLMQGGLYGTIVAIDHEDLDAPVDVEIAPGVIIEVHSQAILRVIDPVEELEELEEYDDASDDDGAEFDTRADALSDAPSIESIDPDTDKKSEA